MHPLLACSPSLGLALLYEGLVAAAAESRWKGETYCVAPALHFNTGSRSHALFLCHKCILGLELLNLIWQQLCVQCPALFSGVHFQWTPTNFSEGPAASIPSKGKPER